MSKRRTYISPEPTVAIPTNTPLKLLPSAAQLTTHTLAPYQNRMFRAWALGVVAVGIAAAAPSSARSQEPRPWKCLDSRPVDLEVGFQEFLDSDRAQEDWHAFLRDQPIVLNQQTNTYRVLVEVEKRDKQPYAYVPPPSIDPNSTEALILRDTRKTVEVPYLLAGGIVNVLTLHPFLEGHYDVTKAALRTEFSFYAEAAEVVSSASRDPDFFSWRLDKAHAQTSMVKGKVVVAPENFISGTQAMAEFLDYVASETVTINDLCKADDRLGALYHVGIGLHGIQDLAAHKGRTAAEHSWNSNCQNRAWDGGCADKKDGDPDEDPDNIKLAKTFSKRWLTKLRSLVGEKCWETLKTYQGTQGSWSDYLVRLATKRDLTLAVYLEYKAMGPPYASLPRSATIVLQKLIGKIYGTFTLTDFGILIGCVRQAVGSIMFMNGEILFSKAVPLS